MLAPSWASSGRIPSLDGMRAIAILMVILSHVTHNGFPGAWSVGHFGVTSFFVISGFLITLLLIRERQRKGTISIVDFYKRRAFRILPAYLVLLTAIAALALAGMYAISLSTWLRVFTYTSCFSLTTMASVLEHTWSLSVEEHFYFLWPLLFRYTRPRTAVALLAAYMAAAPFVRWLILRNNVSWLDPSYSSPSQMASIAVGCLLAFALTSERLLSPRVLAALGIVLLAAPSVFFRHPELQKCLSDTLRASGFGLVMIAILFLQQTNWLARILNSKLLVWIGVLSYSLYLWQGPLTAKNVPLWWGVPALFITASISYYFIERPFLALKESLVRKTGEVPSAPPLLGQQ